mgnify:CR=1 FL=1
MAPHQHRLEEDVEERVELAEHAEHAQLVVEEEHIEAVEDADAVVLEDQVEDLVVVAVAEEDKVADADEDEDVDNKVEIIIAPHVIWHQELLDVANLIGMHRAFKYIMLLSTLCFKLNA